MQPKYLSKIFKVTAYIFREVSLAAILFAVSISSSFAQSVNPEKPASLQPGVNSAVIGNDVALSHYFYFTGLPGNAQLTFNFSTSGFAGGGGSITVVLLDNNRNQLKRYQLESKAKGQIFSSNAKTAQLVVPAKFVKKAKYIVRIDPPGNSLLRAAGTYEIEATGAVQFDPPLSGADPIIGTYSNGSDIVKFLPDGTIKTATGDMGNWEMFDKDLKLYTVVLGDRKYNLKLQPARGLVTADSPSGVPDFKFIK
jgi:hypothetical protein